MNKLFVALFSSGVLSLATAATAFAAPGMIPARNDSLVIKAADLDVNAYIEDDGADVEVYTDADAYAPVYDDDDTWYERRDYAWRRYERGPRVGLVIRGDDRRGCRYERDQCADRWGWNSRRFDRCMARSGC
jgi:hypothetical protein